MALDAGGVVQEGLAVISVPGSGGGGRRGSGGGGGRRRGGRGEGSEKGARQPEGAPPPEGEVFFSHFQAQNRDITVVAVEWFAGTLGLLGPELGKKKRGAPRKGLRVLEALAGTGVRAARVALEARGVAHVTANDANPAARDALLATVERNGLEGIMEVSGRDAIQLLEESVAGFDVVEIDPCGSPASILPAAVRAVASPGLLCINAFDLDQLEGHTPAGRARCANRYGAYPSPGRCAGEAARRLLLGAVARRAAEAGRRIEPVLCAVLEYHVKLIVLVTDEDKDEGGGGMEPSLVHVQGGEGGATERCRWGREHGAAACEQCPGPGNGAEGWAGPLWAGATGSSEAAAALASAAAMRKQKAPAAERARWGRAEGLLSALSQEELVGGEEGGASEKLSLPAVEDVRDLVSEAVRGEGEGEAVRGGGEGELDVSATRAGVMRALRGRGFATSPSHISHAAVRTTAPRAAMLAAASRAAAYRTLAPAPAPAGGAASPPWAPPPDLDMGTPLVGGVGGGRILSVGVAGAGFEGVGEALAAARDGDTLALAGGTYNEGGTLVVRAAIAIKAAGGGAVTLSSRGMAVDTIRVECRGVSIRGVSIVHLGDGGEEGGRRGGSGGHAVAVSGGEASVSLSSCRVSSAARAAVGAFSGASCALADCRVEGGLIAGGRATLAAGSTTVSGGGIDIRAGACGELVGCILRAERKSALFVHTSGRATMRGGRIEGAGLACVEVASNGRAELSGVHMSRSSGGGVLVHAAGTASLSRCVVTSHAMSGCDVRDGGALELAGGTQVLECGKSGLYIHMSGHVLLGPGGVRVAGNAHHDIEVHSGGRTDRWASDVDTRPSSEGGRGPSLGELEGHGVFLSAERDPERERDRGGDLSAQEAARGGGRGGANPAVASALAFRPRSVRGAAVPLQPKGRTRAVGDIVLLEPIDRGIVPSWQRAEYLGVVVATAGGPPGAVGVAPLGRLLSTAAAGVSAGAPPTPLREVAAAATAGGVDVPAWVEWVPAPSPRLRSAGLWPAEPPGGQAPEPLVHTWQLEREHLDGLVAEARRAVYTPQPGRYEFGSVQRLASRLSWCGAIEDAVRRQVSAAWGAGFASTVSISATDAFFLRYGRGSAIPPVHMDISVTPEGMQQVANVIFYLTGAPEVAGGETVLAGLESRGGGGGKPKLFVVPQTVPPVAGKVAMWRSYGRDGLVDPRASHTASPVRAGVKLAYCLRVRKALFGQAGAGAAKESEGEGEGEMPPPPPPAPPSPPGSPSRTPKRPRHGPPGGEEAVGSAEKLQAEGGIEESGAYDGIEESGAYDGHADMLHDVERNEAYNLAITAAAAEGVELAIDIGTGTGLLAMMAARGGARHVVAFETVRQTAALARRVTQSCGYEGKISVVHAHSTEAVEVPGGGAAKAGGALASWTIEDGDGRTCGPYPLATLVVSELLDNALLGEGLLPSLRHAAKVLLAPGYRAVPSRAVVSAQLVHCPALWASHDTSPWVGEGPAGACRGPMGYVDLHAEALLATGQMEAVSEPADVLLFDFRDLPGPEGRSEVVELPARRGGGPGGASGAGAPRTSPLPPAHGLLVWWTCDLDDGGRHVDTTRPFSGGGPSAPLRGRDHWRQALYFLPAPLEPPGGPGLAPGEDPPPYRMSISHDDDDLWVAPVGGGGGTPSPDRPYCTCGVHWSWGRQRIGLYNDSSYLEAVRRAAVGAVGSVLALAGTHRGAHVLDIADGPAMALAVAEMAAGGGLEGVRSITSWESSRGAAAAARAAVAQARLPVVVREVSEDSAPEPEPGKDQDKDVTVLLWEPCLTDLQGSWAGPAVVHLWHALRSGSVQHGRPAKVSPARATVRYCLVDCEGLAARHAPVGEVEGFDVSLFNRLVRGSPAPRGNPFSPPPRSLTSHRVVLTLAATRCGAQWKAPSTSGQPVSIPLWMYWHRVLSDPADLFEVEFESEAAGWGEGATSAETPRWAGRAQCLVRPEDGRGEGKEGGAGCKVRAICFWVDFHMQGSETNSLGADNVITTGPGAEGGGGIGSFSRHTHWNQGLVFLPEPLAVPAAGQMVEVLAEFDALSGDFVGSARYSGGGQ